MPLAEPDAAASTQASSAMISHGEMLVPPAPQNDRSIHGIVESGSGEPTAVLPDDSLSGAVAAPEVMPKGEAALNSGEPAVREETRSGANIDSGAFGMSRAGARGSSQLGL